MHRLVLSTLLICACQDTSVRGRSEEMRHPDAQFVRGASLDDQTVSLTDPSGSRDTIVLPSGRALRLGAAAQPPEQVFGSVTDVARDGAGRIFVLDSRLNQVSVFDSSGHRVHLIGRSGRGPGEFLRATAMLLSGDTLLYVGDRSEQVHVFGRLPNGQFKYRSSLAIPVSADGLCLLNGDLYVHGASPTDSLAIHRYDGAGRHVGAFATIYRSPHPRANMEAMRGRIACSDELGLIAYAPEGMLGEVRAFSPSGDQVWRLALEGFRPVDVVASPTAFSVRLPASGFHRIDGLAWLPDSSLLVQVAHLTPGGAAQDTEVIVQEVTNIRIEGSNGRARLVANKLPVVRGVSGSTMLSTTEDPYPAVSVWQ